MRTKILIVLLLLIQIVAPAQTPVFSWAREGLGAGLEAGNAIAVDAAGNVYTTGYFETTVDFDHGAGITNLTSVGMKDAFIMKTDASGNLLWVKSIGGSGDEKGNTIAVDASGNVYIGGDFEGTADLDPGAGTSNLTQTNSFYTASFVLKLNTAGTFVWAKQFGGTTGSVRLNKIVLDATGNPLITGAFVSSAGQDFDPNAGTVNLTAVYQDVYILKLTTVGNFSWVKKVAGANALNYAEAYDMETDPSGNIVVVGIVHGTFDFDPGAGTANITTQGFGDCFVAKYTSAGLYIWAGITGGTSASTVVWNSELAIDAAGYIYITDYCNNGTIDFDITAGVNNIVISGSKTSIQKLTPNGNLVWVKILGVSNGSTPICVGSTGLYISSYFSGTVDFNTGAGVFNLTSTTSPFPSYNNDCYLLKMDTAGNFISALKYGARFNDYVEDLWLDATGNTHTTGYFNGEGDFDPGAGVSTLYSNGATDIFIQKLNSSGAYQWANSFGGVNYQWLNAVSKNVGTYVSSTGTFEGSTSSTSGNFLRGKGGNDIMVNKVSTTGNNFDVWYGMGGPGNDGGTGIISDAADNVYVTGYFEQTADFAPKRSAPSYSLTSSGGKDIFILKIISSGELVWAKRIGSTSDDESTAIALDNSGNLYVTGYFQGTVEFNPSILLNTLTSAGSLDAFILKMDTAGNYIWARNVGGLISDIGNDITLDGVGNVITTGLFNATADMNPSGAIFNLTSVGNNDAFVLKLNSAGTFLWAKQFGSSQNERGFCVATDAANNVIVGGGFGGATDFDPGAGVFTITPPSTAGEIFLCELSSAGNFVFAKSMGGTAADVINGLTLDAVGNIYSTGTFSGTADLDPRPGSTLNFTSNGSSDVFINCFNPSTDQSWTRVIGGALFDGGMGIAVDPSYSVYVMGNFGDAFDFNPDAGVFNLTAMGASDIFAMKFTQLSPLPVELLSFSAKPIDNKEVICKWATATESNNDFFTVEKSTDAIHFESAGTIDGAGYSSVITNYSFTDKHPYNGVSYYRLKQTDFNGAFTYSQIVAVQIKTASTISVYPILTTGEIFISSSTKLQNATATILNAEGKIIASYSLNADGGEKQISLAPLSNGFYFLIVTTANDRQIFKVVKQ